MDLLEFSEDCLCVSNKNFNIDSVFTLVRCMFERTVDIFYISLEHKNYLNLYLYSYNEERKYFESLKQIEKYKNDPRLKNSIHKVKNEIKKLEENQAKIFDFYGKINEIRKRLPDFDAVYIPYRILSKSAHSNLLNIVEKRKINFIDVEENRRAILSFIAMLLYHAFKVVKKIAEDNIAHDLVKNILKISNPEMKEYFEKAK
jgi:hypothetical protein